MHAFNGAALQVPGLNRRKSCEGVGGIGMLKILGLAA